MYSHCINQCGHNIYDQLISVTIIIAVASGSIKYDRGHCHDCAS